MKFKIKEIQRKFGVNKSQAKKIKHELMKAWLGGRLSIAESSLCGMVPSPPSEPSAIGDLPWGPFNEDWPVTSWTNSQMYLLKEARWQIIPRYDSTSGIST